MLRATGNANSEVTPEKPMASKIANRAPKSVQTRMAHARYTIRAVREMIQFLEIGR